MPKICVQSRRGQGRVRVVGLHEKKASGRKPRKFSWPGRWHVFTAVQNVINIPIKTEGQKSDHIDHIAVQACHMLEREA